MSPYRLRTASTSDYEFLKNIHHTTLKEHISKIWGWDEAAQDKFFRESLGAADVQIIQSGNAPVGYLQLRSSEGMLYIVNILIHIKFQNQKIGTAVIKDLIAKSSIARQILRLGVFKVNTRAKRLYDSLGFEVYEETETHYLMQLKSKTDS